MSGLIVLIGNSGFVGLADGVHRRVVKLANRVSVNRVYSLLMALVCWLVKGNRPQDCGLPGVNEIETSEGHPPVSWENAFLMHQRLVSRSY